MVFQICRLYRDCIHFFYCACVLLFTVNDCTDGDFRLVDGSNALEGRVEVCRGTVWGTITDDFWGIQEARVLCGQLGPYRTDCECTINIACF